VAGNSTVSIQTVAASGGKIGRMRRKSAESAGRGGVEKPAPMP